MNNNDNKIKTIFILEPIVPKDSWIGHWPSFHLMMINDLVECGFNIISLTPNAEFVQKHFINNSRVKCYEFESLLSEDIIPKSKENNKPPSLIQRVKNKLQPFMNRLSGSKSFIKKLVPPVLIDWLFLILNPIKKICSLNQKCLKEVKAIQELNSQLSIEYISNEFNRKNQCFETIQKYLSCFNKISKKEDISLTNLKVFFSLIDPHFFRFGSFESLFPYSWCALWIQTQYDSKNIKKQNVDFFKNKYCKGIGILEENKVEELKLALDKTNVILFPDVTFSDLGINQNYPLVSQIQREKNNKPVIMQIGSLAILKGILNFAKTAWLDKELKYYFCMIGHHHDLAYDVSTEFRFLLQSLALKKNTLFYFNKIHEDKDYDALVCSADILYAAYRDFPWSSNTLAKAAYFKKPIIVSEGHLMEKRIEEFGIGLAIPQDNPEKCLEAIDCLLRGVDFEGKSLKFDFEGYCKIHSRENFKKSLKELVERL